MSPLLKFGHRTPIHSVLRYARKSLYKLFRIRIMSLRGERSPRRLRSVPVASNPPITNICCSQGDCFAVCARNDILCFVFYNHSMDEQSERTLARLIRETRVAALGTLHDGEPNLAMVAYSFADDFSALDRKSTRLNSSHMSISYAV